MRKGIYQKRPANIIYGEAQQHLRLGMKLRHALHHCPAPSPTLHWGLSSTVVVKKQKQKSECNSITESNLVPTGQANKSRDDLQGKELRLYPESQQTQEMVESCPQNTILPELESGSFYIKGEGLQPSISGSTSPFPHQQPLEGACEFHLPVDTYRWA